MLAAGIKVGPSESGSAEPKKKAAYDSKKKKSKLELQVHDFCIVCNLAPLLTPSH